MSAPKTEQLFVQCAVGLEPALLAELQALGHSAQAVKGGARLTGPEKTYEQLNLELRVAERVSLELGRADAPATRQSLRAVWNGQDPLAADVTQGASQLAAMTARQLGVRFTHEPSALILRLRQEGSQPGAIVSIDTTGELLYRRGYRQETSHAPLRETLAAGLLWLAGYRGQGAVWDPMCGSGTFVLEAARWSRHIAPGGERSFAFEKFPEHDAEAFARRRDVLRERELPRAPAPIWGTDIHSGSLGVARRNGRRARVQEDVKLAREDATKLPAAPSPTGLCIVNLPYGERVGDRKTLEALYRGFFRSLLTTCRGWTLGAYAQDLALLERSSGLAFSARHAVSNGGLSCTLAVGVIP